MKPWVFLFEESLGKFIPESFQAATDAIVKKHGEAFPYGTADQDWIPLAAHRGWVIVSKDKRIRKRRMELEALVVAKARLFYLRYGDLSRQASADAFIAAYPKMLRILEETEPPFIARVGPSGSVDLENLSSA